MSELFYPQEPNHPVPKPVFQPGVRPDGPPPAASLWGAHDPAIYKDPISGNYYIYCTGAMCHRSKDLINWERIGKVVEEPPQESFEWVGGKAIWAPDIVKVGDEYRLYCSNSSWGVRQSCIFLAVADNAEGPFIPRGCVLKTSDQVPVNGIDANIMEDVESGEQYMIYGSFWGGIHILKLNKETGLAAEEGIGTCIACRPRWADCAIEGPYVRYNEATGYYYLFVSYGSLNNDYNIRVGRSKNLTGPYYDHNGRCMTDTEDYTNEVGYLLHCGYQFDDAQPWMAPGHNSVLHDTDGKWYLICHIRPRSFHRPDMSTMHCHQMFWSEDGWPYLNPCEYAGEQMAASITEQDVMGEYDRIRLAPAIPQGITASVMMKLLPYGRLEIMSLVGTWKIVELDTVELRFGDITERCKVIPSWDYDTWRPCLALAGMDQNHIGVWAKKTL